MIDLLQPYMVIALKLITGMVGILFRKENGLIAIQMSR